MGKEQAWTEKGFDTSRSALVINKTAGKSSAMDSEEQTGGESCQKATLVTQVVINKGKK